MIIPQYSYLPGSTLAGRRLDIFVVLMLFVISGNPFIAYAFGLELMLIVSSLFLVIVLLVKRKGVIGKKSIYIFLFFVSIFLLQTMSFDSLQVVTQAGFLIRLFIGYAVVRIVMDAPLQLMQVMKALCLLSLVFWMVGIVALNAEVLSIFPQQEINPWTSEVKYLLFFHTYILDEHGILLRNAGMFWEPGAFAGYINLSLILLALLKARLKKTEYRKFLAVFVVTQITTVSSQGYFILPLVLLLHFNVDGLGFRQWLSKRPEILVVIFMLLAVTTIAFLNLPFLGEKFTKQWEQAVEIDIDEVHTMPTRIGSALLDWQYIKESPLIGNGLHEKTRYRYHVDDLQEGYSNGLTDFIAKFGIMGLCLLLLYSYQGFKRLSQNKVAAFSATMLILLILNGEMFLNHSLFLSLMFFKWAKFSTDGVLTRG